MYAHPTVLPDDLVTVTETFQAAGYEPFFCSGHLMASHDLAYGQGVPDGNVFVLGTLESARYGREGLGWRIGGLHNASGGVVPSAENRRHAREALAGRS